MKLNSFSFVLFFSVLSYGQQSYQKSMMLMGCSFEITVVGNDEKIANRHIDVAVKEIKRIESLISSWDQNTQTSLINRFSGLKPVKVNAELFHLIKRASKISKLTEGAFDISYASMDQVWFFDGSMTKIPSVSAVAESVSRVGFQNIVLDEENKTVFLNKKGMKIGFGAIGKGYAADRAKSLLKKKGVRSGVINASGDINAWGTQPNGKEWLVAIKNPLNKEKIFSWMPIHDSAIVTSGNYEKYVKFNDVLYTHIIDPRTGYPAKDILSVTVFTKTAELADALATSVFVMGADTGVDLINQLKGVECVIIDKDNNLITSDNIALKTIKND